MRGAQCSARGDNLLLEFIAVVADVRAERLELEGAGRRVARGAREACLLRLARSARVGRELDHRHLVQRPRAQLQQRLDVRVRHVQRRADRVPVRHERRVVVARVAQTPGVQTGCNVLHTCSCMYIAFSSFERSGGELKFTVVKSHTQLRAALAHCRRPRDPSLEASRVRVGLYGM